MTVDQLKVELAKRGSTRSGCKAILQRRLHALIVQAAIEQSGEDMDPPTDLIVLYLRPVEDSQSVCRGQNYP